MIWPGRWFSELLRRALGLFVPDDLVRNRERMVIRAISLVVALFIFYLISSTYFPQYNPINTFRYVRGTNTYTFYSTEGGLYEQLGDHLDGTVNEISIVNDTEPSGSKEIARAVAADTVSMAIVQSDVLRREGYGEREISVIATVYQEKVHVFYSRAHYDRVSEAYCSKSMRTCPPNFSPMIKPEPDGFTEQFFMGARVRLKSSNSAPHMSLASNILDICGLFQGVEPRGKNFTDALESLVEDELDVVFWTGGEPNLKARKILDDSNGKILMMNVHPEVRDDLGRIYDRPMEQTSIGKKAYRGSDEITTLATDALLVANPNVPGWVIRMVASRLMTFKPSGGDHEDSPLKGSDFVDRINRTYRSKIVALVETGVVLIFFVYAVGALVSALLLWLVSSAKESRYLQQITDTYGKSLAMHTELEMQSSALVVPVVAYGAKNRVNQVAEGLATLTELIARIRDDSVTGGITVNHQRHIMESAYKVREILRAALARGLERVGNEGGEFTLRELRDYFYSGYISREAYNDLQGLVGMVRPPGS